MSKEYIKKEEKKQRKSRRGKSFLVISLSVIVGIILGIAIALLWWEEKANIDRIKVEQLTKEINQLKKDISDAKLYVYLGQLMPDGRMELGSGSTYETEISIILRKAQDSLKINNVEGAEKIYLELLNKFPRFPWTYVYLADLQKNEENATKFYSIAETHFEKIVNLIQPHQPSFDNGLAYCYLKLNKIEKAEALYKKLKIMFPNSASSYVGLGAVWMLKKDYKRAQEEFKKALELDPDSEEAKANLEKVQKLLQTHSQ